MKIEKQLISFRYSKDFLYNLKKYEKLSVAIKQLKTSSHSQCPCCGTTDAFLVAEVDREGFHCDTVICKTCELVFNNSYIQDPDSYYRHSFGNDRWKDPETNFRKRIRPDHYSWIRMAWVISSLKTSKISINKVLEIGCGDGCNLYPYHLIGKRVRGYDYGEEYLQAGRKRGMDLVNGDFSKDKDRPYDLILVIHTFEHLIELDQFVQQVHPLLAEDGWVYVEVPGLIGLNKKWEDTAKEGKLTSSNNIMSYLQFQHNYHFDLPHLMEIWQRNGFEMIQGDEWIRALFKKNQVTGNISFDKKVLTYLQNVENDFLSPKSMIKKVFRKMLKVE